MKSICKVEITYTYQVCRSRNEKWEGSLRKSLVLGRAIIMCEYIKT